MVFPKKALGRELLPALLFFILSVFLRLKFVETLYLPPYFDSVEHFRIIKTLTTALETSKLLETIPSLIPRYYHLGFHVLASILTFGLRADPIDVILILGQLMLAAIPIPLFFLLRRETDDTAAAIFGTLLAGFGWYMPGFAVNWGKYPALAGLLAFNLTLGIAYQITRKKIPVAALGISVLAAALFHSRTLVLAVISLVSWIIATKMATLRKRFQYLLLGIFISGILYLGLRIQNEPLLALALDPYLDEGLWVTLIVFILSTFAFVKFPKISYFNIFFLFFVLLSLFIPLDRILSGYGSQTPLDRPFVEMVLYLPLSLLGGLGLAALLRTLGGISVLPEKRRLLIQTLAVILIIAPVGFLSFWNYDFSPSDCCNYVQYGDTVAFDWLNLNTPPDARILVSGSGLQVIPSAPSSGLVGTDAGIWVRQMTGRKIVLRPHTLDFSATETLRELCQAQVDFIYVGNTSQSFGLAKMDEKEEWYRKALSLPDVQILQVTGCSPVN